MRYIGLTLMHEHLSFFSALKRILRDKDLHDVYSLWSVGKTLDEEMRYIKKCAT